MLNPFTHPSSNKLLDEIIAHFKAGNFYQKKNRHIIFLCGGSVRAYSRSLRKKFIRYTSKNLPQFRILLAETVVDDISQHNEPEFYNIADFETFLAEISDCLLIFPESAGSIAEIGFFSNNPNTAKKVLAVVDLNKQHDSFIYVGPIDKIRSTSLFKDVVIDYSKPDFTPIKKRLEERLPTKKSKSLSYIKFIDGSVSPPIVGTVTVLR